nr:PilZ domain-containing protein [Bacteroidota bacterium]
MTIYESRELRTETTMTADISDGKHTFKGVVVDVSRKGLKVMEIPQKFDFYSKKYTAVIAEKGKNFKFHLKPRWSKIDPPYKEIGFQIISPPLEWVKFINGLERAELTMESSPY